MILILLLVHLLMLINTQFTLWPEIVVYPYLINNDFLLYKDIINPYPPLLTWFLAFFTKIFEYVPSTYQILTWAVILIIDLSIYTITKKLFKRRSYQLTSTLFFIILSIPFGVNGLWFDLVQTPLILWALYFFYEFLNSKAKSSLKLNFFVSFLFLTIAFFIKQQVFWVAALFLISALSKYKFDLFKFLKNHYLSVLPFAVFLIFNFVYFLEHGTLTNFAFWVFYFPALLASKMSGYILLPSIKQIVVVFALFVLFLPTILKKSHVLFLITAAALILFAYPRFDYFHLIPVLSAIAVVFGPNSEYFKKLKIAPRGFSLIALIFLGLFTYRYFQNHWQKEVRFFEQDVFENARVIDLLVEENDKVYLQNAPDQLLSLSGTLPTKPWADDFPWYLEVANLQNRVRDELEAEKPRFIIFQPYLKGKKYELGSYRPDDIADYIDNNYENFAQIDGNLYIRVRK